MNQALRTKPPEKELVIQRVFPAPRRLVWDAWTRPEHLARWWGPKGFNLPTCEMDFRVGGNYHWVMRDSAGNEYPMRGKFLEIVPQERLVFSADIAMPDPEHEVMTYVTFTDHGDQTAVTLKQTYYRVLNQAMDGAPIGWSQSLDKLEAYLLQAGKAIH